MIKYITSFKEFALKHETTFAILYVCTLLYMFFDKHFPIIWVGV